MQISADAKNWEMQLSGIVIFHIDVAISWFSQRIANFMTEAEVATANECC